MHRCGNGRLRRLGVFAGLTVVAALAVVSATSASVDVGNSGSSVVVRASGEGKVFVCKYVGKPGVDERLQTGNNPISVSVNAIKVDPVVVGAYFADAQGRSFVLAYDVGQPEPNVSACPQPDVPPTDVCPNIEGNQATIPGGMVKDEQGNCVTPPPTGAKHLVVTKTAGTSWYKVYTWDVEKSVDKGQLDLKPGESGSVAWKVDVKQTGWIAQNMVVGGTITVTNPNGTAVQGVSLTDGLPGTTVFCGENDPAALAVPANGSITCIYAAPVQSTDGGTNSATAVGQLDGVDVSATGSATFAFSATPNYEINKTVKAIDGNNTWSGLTGTASFGYEEEFPCSSRGRTNVVDLLGDNPETPQTETDFVLDTDSASVTVRCSSTQPPPSSTDLCPNLEGNQASVPGGLVKDEHGNCVTPTPPPPTVKSDEFMDVRVIKEATPQVGLVNGQAEISYTVLVRNDGPNQAHNVVVTDAAPGGVTFLAVTQPVNGSCTVTPALLSCSLGTLGPGVERSIVLTARVTQPGTYVNSATATGDGKDTNGANNTDDASTLVTAPATPPTAAPTPKPKPVAKPKPKPAVQAPMCRVLRVTPGMVKATGNRQLVIAKVTQSRNPVKGVAVRFTGEGLSKVVKTNAQGVARFSIAPRRAGIMLVKITSVKACNTARIGVIGAFEPPVTG